MQLLAQPASMVTTSITPALLRSLAARLPLLPVSAAPAQMATISTLEPAPHARLHQALDALHALLELRLLALAAPLGTSQSLTTAKLALSLAAVLAPVPSAPAVPARMATTERLPALPVVLTAPLAHQEVLALAKQDMRTGPREAAL